MPPSAPDDWPEPAPSTTLASLGRNLSRRLSGSHHIQEATHRHVEIGEEEATKARLHQEPYRPGPPHTGPGVQTNEVITSQYTFYNFLFLNLWRQFKRPANCYFLFISALQCVKAVSITNGVPTTLLPLLFVLFVTAVKDGLEDWNRHRSDATENNRHTHLLTKEKQWDLHHAKLTKWHDVKVGDIVVCKNRELIPADMVLLASSETSGLAFVMTANLDGETNLKAKEVHKDIRALALESKIEGAEFVCDLPNNNLEHFEGTYSMEAAPAAGGAGGGGGDEEDGKSLKLALTGRNLLLRGCVLRNTQWAVGVVVYTGKETKIQMNAAEAPQKFGSVRRFTDKMTMMVLCLQLLCCLIGGIAGGIFVYQGRNMDYIWGGVTPPNPVFAGFLQFWTFIILFTNFIPISLLVTLDMVRFLQGVMMMQDLNMYYETLNNDGEVVEIPTQVRSSDLNEELGVIEHVFSDKTGTLTCNVMEFSKCSINGTSYGLGITQIGRSFMKRNNIPIVEPPPRDPSEPVTPFVNLIDPALTVVMKDAAHPNHAKAKDFFLALSLNHDVMPEGHENEGRGIIYSGSSPDETALVYAAKHFGFFFTKREPGKVTVKIEGKDVEFNVLHVLEFTSDRKKSSVVLKRQDGSIALFCKGADNIIKSRLSSTLNSPEDMATVDAHVDQYVKDGLRTLLLAKAELDPKDYQAWAARYHKAETSIKDRDEKRWALMEELETELEVMGITAIEDKLQDGVPDTIFALRQAGIKVWVLTGDKVDTAINIGYSCSLLAIDMTLLRLCGEDGEMEVDKEKVPKKDSIQRKMEALLQQETSGNGNGNGNGGAGAAAASRALIVDTYALAAILKYELQDLMLQLCKICVSVVCARVSPRQKAKVVEMVKKADPTVQTLSIGDGANDVPMLQAAHVGVGIFGTEGQQAVNNSDFAVGQFRFLGNLLLQHGRFNFRRISKVILYIFYKNALLVLPQFFFGIKSEFSGQNFYFDGFYQLFNVSYTAFCIIALGVLDRDVPSKVALEIPALYRDGLERVFLNIRVFWLWMFEGILHACLVVFLPMAAYGYFNILADGENVGLWDLGSLVFLAVITVASLRIATEVMEWQWIITFLLIASLLFWWLTWAIFSNWIIFPQIYGSLQELPKSSRFWLTYLLASTACFIITFFVESLMVFFHPRRSQIVREQLQGYGAKVVPGPVVAGATAGQAEPEAAVMEKEAPDGWTELELAPTVAIVTQS